MRREHKGLNPASQDFTQYDTQAAGPDGRCRLAKKTFPARKSDVTLAWDQRVALLDTKKSEIVQG